MIKKTSKNKSLAYVLLILGLALIGVGYYTSGPKESPDTIPGDTAAAVTPATPPPAAATLDQAATQTAADQAKPADAEKKTFVPIVQPQGRSIGALDAPVQIIEFSSLTCSHCAHFHNKILDELRVKYIDTGKARIEFRSFPLNQPALDGTKLLACLPETQYYAFMSMLFQTQNHWAFAPNYKDILKQNAQLAGLSNEAFDKCLDDKAAEDKLVQDVVKDVEKYKLQSTPTFIINDGAARVVGAGSIEDFAREIEPLLAGQTPPSAPTPDATEKGSPAP